MAASKREKLSTNVHYASYWRISGGCFPMFLLISAAIGACPDTSDINIPDNRYHVIPAKLYEGCSIVTANIAEGIKVIGDRAFYMNSKLKTVKLPSSLEILGIASFCKCTSLSSIDLPDGLLEIHNSALRKLSVTSLVLPASLRVINDLAFLENHQLQSISFRGTSSSQNEFFIIENKACLYSAGHETLITVINSVSTVQIHKDTQIIGSHAFAFCNKYTIGKIVLPDSIWYISERAFFLCSVTHLVIGSGLTGTHEQAFDTMTYLEKVEMPTPNEFFEAMDGILYTRGLVDLVLYPMRLSGTTFVIPAETRGFGQISLGCSSNDVYRYTINAFQASSGSVYIKCVSGIAYNKNMSVLIRVPPRFKGEVVVPESVTEIGSGAFYTCYDVTNVVLPTGLLAIRSYSFGQLPITQLVLPETVTVLSYRSFSWSGIQSLVIPSSVEVVPRGACYLMRSLLSVEIKAARVIEELAFRYCDILKSVKLPETLTSIGKLAFSDAAISQITLPSKYLTRLEHQCFSMCTMLSSIVIPACVQYVNDKAFEHCWSLVSVSAQSCGTWVSPEAFHASENVAFVCIASAPFTRDVGVKMTQKLCISVECVCYTVFMSM